jgi:hypothetical protein
MESRLGLLEARVGELTEAIRTLQARIAALESGGPAAADEPDAGPLFRRQPGADRGSPDSVLPLLGRASLILGGAFLLRLLTESGALPSPAGIFLGLAYAGFWLAVADRAARRGRKPAPVVLGATGLLIACPLLWEAATKFRIFDATTALSVLALFAAAALAIAAARSVPALAWAATLVPAATALALAASTGAILPATAFLVALGIATDRLSETGAGSMVRWPAAAAADLACALLIFVATRPGGPAGPYLGLSLPAARALILLLPAAYVASFAARILLARRSPGVFEGLQTVLALLLGAAGARLIPPAGASGAGLLVPAGLAALGAYAAATRGATDAPPRRFAYFASTALLIFLFFFPASLSRPLAALLWSGLAVATAAAAAGWRRPALAVHSVVYLLGAAFTSGLASWLRDISTAGDLRPVRLSLLALVAALAGAALYALMAGRAPRDRFLQIGSAFGASLAAVTLGGGLVSVAAAALRIESQPVTLEILRSAVLTLMTIAAAFVAGRGRRPEIAWIAWALLAGGAIKILFHDVPSGRAVVLALSFAFYGAALIVAPRFLRAAAGGGPAALPGSPSPTR